jgi:mannan endo-1,4-beta-mannosidase
MKTIAFVIGIAVVAAAQVGAPAVEPADKELIPEARAVLKYLESVYGKKSIAALNGLSNVANVKEAAGREPAIVGFDLSGWNSPPWGKSYSDVVQKTIESTKSWAARGGIVAMQCHWIHPANPDGSAWIGPHGRKTASPPFDFAEAFNPGTEANRELMRDLKGHADYLQQLADARIPVLWRPLHEIEGGWFWWTDQEHPENTAALWRYMFDYFTKERKLHNLIWVYASALRCGKGKEGMTNVPMRKRFYPGPQYVDIVGIDVYPNDGVPHGGVQRSAKAPNSSYFTHWTSPADSITWDIEVHQAGNNTVTLDYTCAATDVGSTVELRFGDSVLAGRIAPAWDPPLVTSEDRVPRETESYLKEFYPLILGTVHLDAGRGPLTLRATHIPGAQVIDLAGISLTLHTDATRQAP